MPSGPVSDTTSCVGSGWSIESATVTVETRPASADTTASQTSGSPVPSGIALPPQEPTGVVASRAAERSRRGVNRPVRLSRTGTPVARRRSNASAGSASGRACRASRTAPVAAGVAAEVPEKIAVRPPPAAVVVHPTPGRENRKAGARRARAGDDVRPGQGVLAGSGSAPGDRSGRRRVHHSRRRRRSRSTRATAGPTSCRRSRRRPRPRGRPRARPRTWTRRPGPPCRRTRGARCRRRG